MQREEALDVLARTEFVRRRTRAALRSTWFPPIVFGMLTLLSAPLYEVSATAVLLYWVVAGPVGFGMVLHHYRQREGRLGLAGPILPEVVASLALFATAVLLSGILARIGYRQPLVPFGWGLPVLGIVVLPPLAAPIAITVGYLVFARLERSPMLGVLALGFGLLIVLVGSAVLTVVYRAALGSLVVRPAFTRGVLVQSRRIRLLVFWVIPVIGYGLTFVVMGLGFRRAEGKTG
jgi:hypothetical protein